ncbi:MAG: hypothetical protein ACLFN8_04215 [Candidatus Woesearchaeota archaeon]
MSLYDEFYTKKTGFSRNEGAVWGFLKYQYHKIKHGGKSTKSRIKRGVVIGFAALLAGYLPNREKIDNKINELHAATIETVQGFRLSLRDAKLSDRVEQSQQKLEYLTNEIDSLKDVRRDLNLDIREYQKNLNQTIKEIQSLDSSKQSINDEIVNKLKYGDELKLKYEIKIDSISEVLQNLMVQKETLQQNLFEQSKQGESKQREYRLLMEQNNREIQAQNRQIAQLNDLTQTTKTQYLREIQTLENELNSIKTTINHIEHSQTQNNQRNNAVTNYSTAQRTNTTNMTIRRATNHRQSTNNNQISQNNYVWTKVDAGKTLSQIAREYYGTASDFVAIANLNNIQNPNFILRNQPILLPAQNIQTTRGTFNTELPEYAQVHRRENIDQFLQRNNLNVSLNELIQYNTTRGNNIPRGQYLINYTDVVYFKKEWAK